MKSVFSPLDWLRYGLAKLAWPGSLGLFLLAAAGLLYGLEVLPMQDTNQTLQQRAERLVKQVRPVHELEVMRPVELSATLPGAERMPDAVTRLFTAAQHAGLTLQQGSYRTLGDKPAGDQSHALARYQINLPITGDYPAVRAFVAEALEREPSLALDGMRMTRESMESAEIDAELRFTLYMGSSR